MVRESTSERMILMNGSIKGGSKLRKKSKQKHRAIWYGKSDKISPELLIEGKTYFFLDFVFAFFTLTSDLFQRSI